MSVVAVKVNYNSISMACDSQVDSNWVYKKDIEKSYGLGKVIDTNSMLIGTAGKLSELSKMTMYAEKSKPSEARIADITQWMLGFIKECKESDNKFEPFNEWILVFNGKVFNIDPDLGIYEVTNYCAIGSGQYHAVPMLEMGKGVKEAVAMACKLDLYCAGPVHTYRRKR